MNRKLIEMELKNLEIARKNSELTNKSIKELRKKKFNKPFPKVPWEGKIKKTTNDNFFSRW